VRLPAANIPAEIAEADPNLRYTPKLRLERDNHAIQIGEHAISTHVRKPYPGWKSFLTEIRALIEAARQTNLIDRLERFALKYVDLIDLGKPHDISCLNARVELCGQHIGSPLYLRAEVQGQGMVQVVQIASAATTVLQGSTTPITGVLLDIETVCQFAHGESWDEVIKRLDEAHIKEEQLFFSLLTDETIAKLGPVYEE
jgi:uncharacterized protein (TIGR04255 family)